MSSLDDIARRLQGVAGIDWSVTERPCDEAYGDWYLIGPVRLLTDFTGLDDETEYDAAVVEFLQHAAADIAYLLTQIDSTACARRSDEA